MPWGEAGVGLKVVCRGAQIRRYAVSFLGLWSPDLVGTRSPAHTEADTAWV